MNDQHHRIEQLAHGLKLSAIVEQYHEVAQDCVKQQKALPTFCSNYCS